MERPSSQRRGKRWGLRRRRPLLKIALLPAVITLGNGVCGTIAILQVGIALHRIGQHDDPSRYLQRAALLILVAMVLDALDGFVARLTKTAGPFGAQLDTLCDLVTFGIAPAFLVFAVTRESQAHSDFWSRVITAACVLYAICALVRLARFTVETTPDESSHREFAGLPSPAAAGVIAGAFLAWPKLMNNEEHAWIVDTMKAALPGLAFGLGILMVSRFRYTHVVTRLLKGKRPFITIVEIALASALVFLFREIAVFLAFFGYALVGPIGWLRSRILRKPAAAAPTPVPGHDTKKTTLL